jgi:hypothetical protein
MFSAHCSGFVKYQDWDFVPLLFDYGDNVMKYNLVGILLVCMSTLFLYGCPHQAAVFNVADEPVVVMGSEHSLEDVKKAIVRAGSALGWNMKMVEPGKIIGTLHLRKHMAKVEIPFTRSSYSILYMDSDKLNYDGKMIHSNYNGWIQNLNRGINNQLNLL